MDKKLIYTIGVAGNPNCGKTSLFNILAGTNQSVGNWSGVTVECKTAEYNYLNTTYKLVDLPGIYSLNASSLDEKVSADYLISNATDIIINVIDASNIERNLYLTIQLLELGLPIILVLNMMDLAKAKNIDINLKLLSQSLNCPIVPIVAAQNKGIETLREVIALTLQKNPNKKPNLNYPLEITSTIKSIKETLISEGYNTKDKNLNFLAIKLLETESLEAIKLSDLTKNKIIEERKKLEKKLNESIDIIFADCRYQVIAEITKQAILKKGTFKQSTTEKIDNIVLNRILGIPIFLTAMYLMFLITINFGETFIDFFEIITGAIFIDGFAQLLCYLRFPTWLIDLLTSGIGGGIQTISSFIPQIGFMFIALCFLEDSGYMTRAAFVMDRFMRLIGLPGKSFIPMLVGFGCNIPAIMATRTLENKQDRILTILMNPFMSCGARLPVYAMFVTVFFPNNGQNLVFLLYAIGVIFAVVSGYILKHTILKGKLSSFIMELPPYHIPILRSVFMRAWDRLKSFVIKAGSVIIPVMLLLSFINSWSIDGNFNHHQNEQSVLSYMSKSVTPIFKPIGISEENWPATLALFTGIFAKESIVGTLDALYSKMAQDKDFPDNQAKADFTSQSNLLTKFKLALKTTKDNLISFFSFNESKSQDSSLSVSTSNTMRHIFKGQIEAFTYLLFVLLYCPCAASLAAIYHELNLRWAIFSCCWNTILAYSVASTFYQIATFSEHPKFSTIYLVSLFSFCLIGLISLKLVVTVQPPIK